MIKAYYLLAKPGIIMGNAITAIAGFVLASDGKIATGLFIAVLTGLSAIIASACVANNYLDRGIDAKMKRTQKRELVTGTISARNALLFAAVLFIAGSYILLRYTNTLTLAAALFGFFTYVAVYGYWKRRSSLGTVIGSISGAVPPVVGYVAVSNRLDLGSALLFLILVLWQMPHFYAIAMYRLEDYRAARIPVLPLVKGVDMTRRSMLLYLAAFCMTVPLLTVFGYTGLTYFFVSLLLALRWLWLGLKNFTDSTQSDWARRIFRFSLIVIILICTVISLDPVLP